LPCLQLQANISKGRSTTRRGRCGGVEKWLFSDSIALRVDVDALHTTFFNNAAKVHDEYDLRATWGISYHLGPTRLGGKFRNMAGPPIE